MMMNVNYDVRNEQNKDMLREAQNERLVRGINEHSNMLKNARQALGRSLVQAGHQLLNER